MSKAHNALDYYWKKTASGKFIGFVMDKPGVMSVGDNLDELMANLRNAYDTMVEYERNENELLISPILSMTAFNKSSLQVA